MKYISLLLILLLAACNNPAKDATITEGDLIPYSEIADTEPHYTRNIKDTITPGGWKITYLVKNDSTRQKDLYIQWSKGGVKQTYTGNHLLELQSYFTPVFKTETTDYIFMESEVRGGNAVLLLPKNTKAPQQFSYIIGYNTAFAQIAYIPESSYSTNELTVEAIDLKSGIKKSVQFTKPCSVLPETSCLLKAEFNGKEIKIYGNSDGSTNITEMKTIAF
ncbi:hypothetical protein AM493_12615 [Flavobacterium akiainvivens]|uniref:Uncharacterized protein n=1 Tax=Flavobacterium akiainvivens TaxID=1202724 RepID=A0A0M8MI88_9FLAO|nr:hypothetical protein [Flavobacterium akiainvivens]KOS06771.1 hypothetical protein AM493_12615 [Flavobacterium akiainvivens]SFQ77082.1 hypothetical protein SAMN05444144_12515 [Flavobacterium akiainvivens]